MRSDETFGFAILFALLALLTLWAAGCGQQVTLVPPGEVVRLAEDTAAKIATFKGLDASGNPVWAVADNKVTLPAGYYVAPPPATRPAK